MRFLYRMFPVMCAILLLFSIAPKQGHAALPVSAHSAILMEQESGRVIYEKNAHERKLIASITKIMTAILAIESGKLDQKVKISSNASGTEGSSLYLKVGEEIKVEDLVYGLMLRSGNDAAVGIAEAVGGSLDGFVWMMNQKAEEIGMKDSHFSNPHGLDNTKDHFSSAYDMALLTRYAMNNEKYRLIAGTKVHRAPNSTESWDYVWKNKNRLLTQLYEYTTGGKTGYTKLAKRTLVTTATKNELNLISVTLNGPDDWNDHIYMYESAFKNFQATELLPKGEITDVNVKLYKNNIFIKNSFTYPLTSEEQKQVEVKYKLLKPKENWEDQRNIPEVVGKVELYLNGKKIGKRSIFYGKASEAFSEKSWSATWKELFQSTLGIGNNG